RDCAGVGDMGAFLLRLPASCYGSAGWVRDEREASGMSEVDKVTALRADRPRGVDDHGADAPASHNVISQGSLSVLGTMIEERPRCPAARLEPPLGTL